MTEFRLLNSSNKNMPLSSVYNYRQILLDDISIVYGQMDDFEDNLPGTF